MNTPPNGGDNANDNTNIDDDGNINVNIGDDSDDIDINDNNANGDIDINDDDNGYDGYDGEMEGLDSCYREFNPTTTYPTQQR